MRSKCFVGLMILVTFLIGARYLGAEELCGDTILTDIKTPHPYPRATTDTLVWSQTIRHSGAGWLKIHFSDFKLNDEDFVVLYDMYGKEIERIKGSDVRDFEKSKFRVIPEEKERVDFWGPMIDGDEVTVELHRTVDRRVGWGFTIDEVGIGFWPIDDPINDVPTIESICGTDVKVDIKCAATAYQTMGLAVGRMLFQKGKSWYLCTGFLVSSCSAHFLTNEHCISKQSVVDTLQVRFKYRYTTCGGSTLDSYTTYYGNTFITDSKTYDYCLLTLQGTPQSTYGYLQLLNRAPVVNEDIYIIQHPGGRPQEIGYGTVDNTTANSGKDLGYYVDTEGGSSGSPVLAENEDKVLGLHHYGGCPNSGVKMDLIYESIIGYLCQ